MAEQTVEEARKAIESEVFGDVDAGSTPPAAEEVATEPVEAATPASEEHAEAAADPWEGVNPMVRQELEALRGKVGAVEGIDARVKQAEKRIGSITNEWAAARQAAKTVSEAPSAAQMEAAATSTAEWNALKEDFPDWGKGIDSRLAAERAEILKQIPDLKAFKEELQRQAREEHQQELAATEAKFNDRLIRFKHPKWDERVKTPDFAAWYEAKGRPDSENPLDVIQILDDYDAHLKTRKPTKAIVADRDKRLEQSQTTPGRKLPPPKSEADMSPEEIRAAVAKEVYGGD